MPKSALECQLVREPKGEPVAQCSTIYFLTPPTQEITCGRRKLMSSKARGTSAPTQILSVDMALDGFMDLPRYIFLLHGTNPSVWWMYEFKSADYPEGVTGIACFSSEVKAERYRSLYISRAEQGSDMEVCGMPLQAARNKAKSIPAPCVALILLDNPQKPFVHYVNSDSEKRSA